MSTKSIWFLSITLLAGIGMRGATFRKRGLFCCTAGLVFLQSLINSLWSPTHSFPNRFSCLSEPSPNVSLKYFSRIPGISFYLKFILNVPSSPGMASLSSLHPVTGLYILFMHIPFHLWIREYTFVHSFSDFLYPFVPSFKAVKNLFVDFGFHC